MNRRKIGRSFLALAIGLFFLTGSAVAKGKKAPIENQGKGMEHELGKEGTMEKSFNPETGEKQMEKTIGHGEKTMTIEKEPHSGATVERSWKTESEEEGASHGKGEARGKDKDKDKEKDDDEAKIKDGDKDKDKDDDKDKDYEGRDKGSSKSSKKGKGKSED